MGIYDVFDIYYIGHSQIELAVILVKKKIKQFNIIILFILVF